MMSRRLRPDALLLTLAFTLPVAAHAGESRFELADGSVITGELMGMESGYYRSHSETLGDLSVPESRVRPLRTSSNRASAPSGHAGEIASIQSRLLSDQCPMDQVISLQREPYVREILAEPELIGMVLSGDLEQARADPRVQRLMSSPAFGHSWTNCWDVEARVARPPEHAALSFR